MDSDRFDDLSRTLGKPESRRIALATIAAFAGLGVLTPFELDAKKKKRKKKKPKCKIVQFNCDAKNKCCGGLTCGGQQSCPAFEGKPYCCASTGQACSEQCDCCDENHSCGSNSKCCFNVGETCANSTECCPGLFCNLEFNICSNPL